MTKRFFAIALAVVGLFVAGASARANDLDDAIKSIMEESELDRFQLWNDCQPMILSFSDISKDDDAVKIGLKNDEIAIAVRSRLRAARLYVDHVRAFLEARGLIRVRVTLTNRAFYTGIKYEKIVNDPASGGAGWASTWDTYSVGTHGSDPSYIVRSISEHMDKFIDEYLRVNASACKS